MYALQGGSTKVEITDPPVHTWFHLVMVWDLQSYTMSVYVNGTNVGIDTTSMGSGTLLPAQGTPALI